MRRQYLKVFLDWVIKPVVSLIFGRAVLLVCHGYGWHPDEYLAALMMEVPNAIANEVALWVFGCYHRGADLGGASLVHRPASGRVLEPSAQGQQLAGPPIDRPDFTPIEDAARLCFDETGLLATWNVPGSARLQNIICHLVAEARENPDRFSLWGVQAPSTSKFQRIPPAKLEWTNTEPQWRQVDRNRRAKRSHLGVGSSFGLEVRTCRRSSNA